jgi:hypothetical protein
MGSKRRTYMKIECDDCGKNIAYNNWAVHLRSCKPYKERIAHERLERLKTKPIEEMAFGEIDESGRIAEYIEYWRNMRRR